jgi:hypothetical protein
VAQLRRLKESPRNLIPNTIEKDYMMNSAFQEFIMVQYALLRICQNLDRSCTGCSVCHLQGRLSGSNQQYQDFYRGKVPMCGAQLFFLDGNALIFEQQKQSGRDFVFWDFIITFEHKYDLKENDKLKFNVHIALFKGLEERIQFFVCW